MATYESNDYTSKGVGTAGLTLGIIGTSLASGLLNGNGLGGILGNGNQTAGVIAEKNLEIAQLRAEKYADGIAREQALEISNLKQRVAAIEVAEPLREQILQERINCVASTVNRLVQPMIPNANVAPGWGPAFVSPFPPVPPVPPVVNSGTTSTPATTSSNG